MKFRHTILIGLSAMLFSHCAATTDQPVTEVGGPINTTCPFQEGEAIDPALSVNFNSMQVGFCCEMCVQHWEGLERTDKQAVIDKIAN